MKRQQGIRFSLMTQVLVIDTREVKVMEGAKREGLTLMELLIVVAIIAALAALLFPVFQSVRERAYIAACSSNLKQLYNALQIYEEDYGELPYIPPGNHRYWEDVVALERVHTAFYYAIYPYVKDHSIFICPAYTGPLYHAHPAYCYYKYYYPYAKWRGYPITSNLVLIFCTSHAKWHEQFAQGVLIVYRSPFLVCLMDGSIHLVHGPWRHRHEDVPFTYP